jgi:hypothetical protein
VVPDTPAKDHWGDSAPTKRVHANLPSGRTVDVGQGLQLVLPFSFKHELKGGALVAADGKNYLIIAGPLVSKFTDPKDIAREYAKQYNLALDGVTNQTYAGELRAVGDFHGKAGGVEISQRVVGYVGTGYSMVVSLSVPYAHRNDAAVRSFMQELFDKRVLVP